ncbi:AK9 [Bugula neritina]|uniref:AK9 n=1 Tax=Bugula neritina TaxID=10212 RepID=A0A7J7JKI3_BUGNE|nr:AK9 [Bugula neritina]
METAEPGNKPLQFGQGKDLVSHSMDLETLLKQSEKTDCYDDDITELKFLLSNPTCFLVLGKPGSGKTAIARKISQNWHCELVNPTELVLQNMEMGTDIGNKCREMLHRGEAVPEEMVAKMIEDKINSPEVAHHGYVLDGLPSLNEDYMTIKDQLEHIKNFNLKPDFIVHVKIPDSDLERRRIGQRVDPLTGEIYTIEVYNPDKPEPKPKQETDEEEEEEEEAEEEEEEVTPVASHYLINLFKFTNWKIFVDI